MRLFSSGTRKAVIIVGHGSREAGFESAMKKVAGAVRKSGRFGDAVCAYLEINQPSIEEAVGQCVRKGISEIRVLPYFLLTGRHVKLHIPEIISKARKKYGRQTRIILCPYLGYDKNIVALAKKRIRESR